MSIKIDEESIRISKGESGYIISIEEKKKVKHAEPVKREPPKVEKEAKEPETVLEVREKERYVCPLCTESFSNLKKYKDHIKEEVSKRTEKEKVIKYLCPICSNEFEDKEEYKNHLKEEIEETRAEEEEKEEKEEYKCDICGETFEQAGALNLHKYNKHGERKEKEEETTPEVKCEHCGKKLHPTGAVTHLNKSHGIEYSDGMVSKHTVRAGKEVSQEEEKTEEGEKEKKERIDEIEDKIRDYLKKNPGSYNKEVREAVIEGKETKKKSQFVSNRLTWMKERGELRAKRDPESLNKYKYYLAEDFEEAEESKETELNRKIKKTVRQNPESKTGEIVNNILGEDYKSGGKMYNRIANRLKTLRKQGELEASKRGSDFLYYIKEEEESEKPDEEEIRNFVLRELKDSNMSIIDIARDYYDNPQLSVGSKYDRVRRVVNDMVSEKLVEKVENGYGITRKGKRELEGGPDQPRFDILIDLIKQKLREGGSRIEPNDLLKSGFMDGIDKGSTELIKDLAEDETVRKALKDRLDRDIRLRLSNKGGGFSLLVT